MHKRPTPKATRLVLSVALLALSGGAFGAPAQNRLIGEKSPYLRQHAFDPVDWYPWGPEAFAKARRENKPIFLSIGYSTCHWCHVMERESFSNPEVAALLNTSFVCVIVDREQRPEIDRLYQAFVQASTGGGGWPLSAWLTPELKPFFGGTYFAPESQPGQPSFKEVLARIATTWAREHDQIVQSSEQMFAALSADLGPSAAGDALPIETLRGRAMAQALENFDAEHGGFEQAPKFPQAVMLDFLLDVHAASADPKQRESSLRMAAATLRAMASGGIHDHVGGGFHRYSVDAEWRVPHFEKMLYDQAQIAGAYLSAWQLTHDPVMRDAARGTLDYVRRDLTSAAGGFYSAEDADSAPLAGPAPPSEGVFYLWTSQEMERLLGGADAALFEFAFGVKPEGNATAELAGGNILYRAHSDADCAARFGMGEKAVQTSLETSTLRLRQARAKRPRPMRDEKIITAWNGLMISALARSAQALGDPGDSAAALKAAGYLREALFDPKTGRLARSSFSGRRDDRGFSEDYAFLIQGLLDLYETTFDVQWLSWAAQLQEKQVELFLDPVSGGFFANTADDPSVMLRLKEDSDGAEPSSNSVSVRNLARLAAMLDRKDWRELATRTARAFGPQVDRSPTALPEMLAAMGWLLGSPQQVLIHGEPATPDTGLLVAEVWKRFLPRHVLIRIDRLSRPFFAERHPIVGDFPKDSAGTATAYVCRNFTCQLPTRDPAVLARLLEGETPGVR